MLSKVFGIISWFPDKEPDRTQRKERINRLFKQLNELWPNIDILVIAQNWQDFKPVKTKNKQIIKYYEPLGILGARKALREEFLKLNYDYIIMFDDDAIIKCDNNHAHIDFMTEIDNHKNGFCFIHGNNNKYHPYIAAQLNLCAISKFIYQQEPMVDIDPQKNEGFEDSIFSCLLHHKYTKYEFTPPATIRPIQFLNKNEYVPSTWWDSDKAKTCQAIILNTNRIEQWIVEHKEFPKHYKQIIKDSNYKGPDKLADGKVGTYLSF